MAWPSLPGLRRRSIRRRRRFVCLRRTGRALSSLPEGFGPKDQEVFAPTDLIIQYTPQMLGAWRWGSPAILGLAVWARRRSINLVLLAHELYLRWDRRPDLALAAASLRLQLAALVRVANRVLVTMEMRVNEVARLARLVGVDRRAGVVRVGTAAMPLTKQSRPDRLRIGMFSTLASTKRFDVLLDCFRIVQARRPEAKELVILGDLGDSGGCQGTGVHFGDRGPSGPRADSPTRKAIPLRDCS